MIKYLKPFGTFLFFSVVSFVGAIFMFFFVKETKGLNDKEKKALYQPVNSNVEKESPGAVEVSEI
jgi:hypothetical protein